MSHLVNQEKMTAQRIAEEHDRRYRFVVKAVGVSTMKPQWRNGHWNADEDDQRLSVDADAIKAEDGEVTIVNAAIRRAFVKAVGPITDDWVGVTAEIEVDWNSKRKQPRWERRTCRILSNRQEDS